MKKEENLLPVGTTMSLKGIPEHVYTKTNSPEDDLGFAWWIFHDPSKPEDRRMMVRQTDEQVLMANHFSVFVPAEDYLNNIQ